MCDDPNIEHTHTRETERHTKRETDRWGGTLRTLRKLSFSGCERKPRKKRRTKRQRQRQIG